MLREFATVFDRRLNFFTGQNWKIPEMVEDTSVFGQNLFVFMFKKINVMLAPHLKKNLT